VENNILDLTYDDDVNNKHKNIINYNFKEEGQPKESYKTFGIIRLKHRCSNENIVVATVHLTTESRDKEGKTRFEELKKLNKYLDDFVKNNLNDHVILMGDFNIDNLADHGNIKHKSIWKEFFVHGKREFKLNNSLTTLVDIYDGLNSNKE